MGDASRSTEVWAERDFVGDYATRSLRPPEVVLLLRYADALAGRVLELGCGAGRITGYLGARGGDVLGIDISPAMVDYCRRRYPRLKFQVGDLADLSGLPDGSRDVVIAEFNVLGVLDDAERTRVLGELRRVLTDGGLLIFSAHNLAFLPNVPKPAALVTRSRNPARILWNLARLPLRERNHRRLGKLERHERDYALVNDQAHDYRLLHYYIGRDAQARQVEAAGFELLECLDGDGAPVEHDEGAAAYPELHYAARAVPLRRA
jgi:SAM-dependent methyltransferase